MVEHEYKNKSTGETEKTKRTSRVTVHGNLGDLKDQFDSALRKLGKHVFNIRNQYRAIQEIKQNLADNEVRLHCDFSENYNLKYAANIQSCHFGASNQQATLHVGMVYLKGQEFGFATVSGCRRHDPSAIWAHLSPIMKKVRQDHPAVDVVYFVSDGPTTQYRCKGNFFLMCTLPFDWGFTAVNWNFLAAGHGKGAADGIGGALKRKADRIVAEGRDLVDIGKLTTELSKNTSIYVRHVSESDVDEIDAVLNAALPLRTLPGTMSVHQLIAHQKGELVFRKVSCVCQGFSCDCYGPVRHQLSLDMNIPKPTSPEPSVSNGNTTPPSPVETRSKMPAVGGPLRPVHEFTNDLLGKHCVVFYRFDGKLYPGIIEDIDYDSLRINAMCRVGRTTYGFFWPKIVDNDVWYEEIDIITLIPEPEPVQGNEDHYRVDKEIWDAVIKSMDEWVRS